MIVKLAAALFLLATAHAGPIAPIVRMHDSKGNLLPGCAYKSGSTLNRLEPSLPGQMMLGMSLDWSHEVPLASVKKMDGYTMAV
ncbi:hypothetical protein HDU98_001118 [Podochytrium sp. JEL0797]|nr:hypothetical protein HDU98_001118 [Podochytrium sp. JEL0797]